MAAMLTTWAILAVTPAQAQDSLPPREQSAEVIVAGCLQRDADGDHWLLANPILGPVESVPDGRCASPVDERTLELEDTDDHGLNDSLLGMWVEIEGRLEKETSDDPDNYREIQMRSFRVVPVVQPRIAEVLPAPPAPEPIPPPVPVATTGIEEPRLPQTAGELPAIGLLGLLGLTGALMLRWRRSWLRE
jgi:hypothetical protein